MKVLKRWGGGGGGGGDDGCVGVEGGAGGVERYESHWPVGVL